MSRFVKSYSGIGDVLRSEMVELHLRERAEKIQLAAEAAAPVGDPAKDPHPGEYKDAFKLESGRRGGFRNDRAYARVKNDSPHAAAVEFGNVHIDAHHVIGGAVDAAREL